MPNIVPDLRAANARARSGIVGLGDGALYAEAAAEIERLRKIETAARALQFSAYPAHGSGFVTQVHGGNINDLEAALAARKE